MFVSLGRPAFEAVSMLEAGLKPAFLEKTEAVLRKCAAFFGATPYITPQFEYLPSVYRYVHLHTPLLAGLQNLVMRYLSPFTSGINEERRFMTYDATSGVIEPFTSVSLNEEELVGQVWKPLPQGYSSVIVRSGDSIFLRQVLPFVFRNVVFGKGHFFIADSQGWVTRWARKEATLSPLPGKSFNCGTIEAMKFDSSSNHCVMVSRKVQRKITLFDSVQKVSVWKRNILLQQARVVEIDLINPTTLLVVFPQAILIGDIRGEPFQIDHETHRCCSNKTHLFTFNFRGVATVFSLPAALPIAELDFAHSIQAACVSANFLVTIQQRPTHHLVLFTELNTWNTHLMVRTQRFMGDDPLKAPVWPEFECALSQDHVWTVVWGATQASRFTFEAPIKPAVTAVTASAASK